MTASIFDQLAELQVRRLGYIRSVNRIDNAAKALVRRSLGWRFDTPDNERKALNTRAAAIVQAIYKGQEPKPEDAEVYAAMAPDIMNYAEARKPFTNARKGIETRMRELARQLPVFPWVESVRGFGDLALAVIIGSAGDLSKYPDRHKLWKRFGLTPHGGQAASTWRRKGGLTADEWTDLGYVAARNAELYAVLGDPLFRQQTMITGVYRQVYDKEKARFLERGETKGRSHMHGLRCMRKAALEDLYRVWNGGRPKKRNLGGQSEPTLMGQTSHTSEAEFSDAA